VNDGHQTSMLPAGDRHSVSLREFIAELDVFMGGRVAEELIYGPDYVTSGASSDIQGATQIATGMVKVRGPWPSPISNVLRIPRARIETLDAAVGSAFRPGKPFR
jgi:hypothetical protein